MGGRSTYSGSLGFQPGGYAGDRFAQRSQSFLRYRHRATHDRAEPESRIDLLERPIPERDRFIDQGITRVAVVGGKHRDLRRALPWHAELGARRCRREQGDQDQAELPAATATGYAA